MNPLATAICARAVEGASGFLDWSEDRRRRIIYFQLGEVTRVQSNLKSESPARLAELTPGLAAADLARATAQARLEGALREAGGELRWQEDMASQRREPADLAEALLAVGARRAEITAYLKVVGRGAAWLRRQRIPRELVDYLLELDGTRTVDEIVSFAPGGPQVIEPWLRVGLAMGVLVDVGIESSTHEVRSLKRERGYEGGVDGIAAMISEGLGERAPKVVRTPETDAPSVRFGPVLQRIREAPDHFSTLGVTWRDPPETMRRAYFSLARELHPDRYVQDAAEIRDIASELFDRARAAWEILGDDTKREAYIKREIHGEKSEDELAMEKVRLILDAERDFKRGLADLHAGRLPQAHELFTQSSRAVPDDHEMAAYAGFTTFKMHQARDAKLADEGVARIKAAVAASETLDAGWVLLGQVHHARGDWAQARDAYVSALRIRPSNPDAVREMKRLEREKTATREPHGGLFNKLFGKK